MSHAERVHAVEGRHHLLERRGFGCIALLLSPFEDQWCLLSAASTRIFNNQIRVRDRGGAGAVPGAPGVPAYLVYLADFNFLNQRDSKYESFN